MAGGATFLGSFLVRWRFLSTSTCSRDCAKAFMFQIRPFRACRFDPSSLGQLRRRANVALFMLIFSQDVGGHALRCPSSLLALRQGVREARRGAGFSLTAPWFRFEAPLSIVTHLPAIKGDGPRGWPALPQYSTDFIHNGPLPKSCPCAAPHKSMKALPAEEPSTS